MGKPAARQGDLTAHGMPAAPGPGACIPPNKAVLIGGKPAWRSPDDTHVCPIPIAPPAPAPHAAEKCYLGSMSVLINGKMAVRQGDMLVGAGPPNSFALGCITVQIGDIAFGLLDPANAAEFCQEFAELVKNWNKMTPQQRQQAMQDMVNKQLAKGGTPNVGVNSANLGQHTNGQLDFNNWNLDVNQNLLSSNTLSATQARGLANTLYHEARHAEQWFAMARTQAAGAAGSTAQVAQTLSTNMAIPQSVANAAAANPLSGNSPQAVFGQAMNNSVYGSRGAFRNNTLNTLNANPGNQMAYQNYRALPEEQDAWNTGDSTPCGK